MGRKAVPPPADRLTNSDRTGSRDASNPILSRQRTADLLKQLRDFRKQARVLKARIDDLQEHARLRDQARANRPIRKPRS